MILELILWIVFLLLCSLLSAAFIYWLHWTMGQPMPVGDGKQADFVPGRILSGIGRRLCDWYGRIEDKEDKRIKQIAATHYLTGEENQTERAKIIAETDRKHRRANIAKAFGACPPCFGTYISLFFVLVIIFGLGFIYSFWFFYLSPVLLVYFWASTLSFLQLFQRYI